jgi:PAS domain-containing protein
MASEQLPLELILARGFVSNLATPAFLVDRDGRLVFYNDAAGELLGVRFEEAGEMGPEEWGTRFEPVDAAGGEIPVEDLPLARAMRGRPAHAQFRIRSVDGAEQDIEVSAFPILGTGGQRGSLAAFWPAETD